MKVVKNSTKILSCALLCILGFLGNWFNLTLFFNVDFLFGSFFTMFAILSIGGAYGVIVGIVAGTCTYFLWNHPWAIIIFAAEAIFVATGYSRRKGNPVVYDILYWVCIGMPLIYLFYHQLMGLHPQSTLLIMLKQSVNGLFNALMASLAWILLQFLRRSSGTSLSYNRVLFVVMVSLVLLPSTFLMVSGMRTYQEKRTQSFQARISSTAEAARRILADWIQERHRNVQILATLIGNPNVNTHENMQHYVEIVKTATPAFKGMGVFDQNSISVSYSPLEQDGKSTLGVDMSARSHIAIMRRDKNPFITDVIMSRLGNPSPIVIFLAPIVISGQYEGYCSGVVEVAQILGLLQNLAPQGTHISVVDAFDRTIVSTLPDLKTMDPFPRPYHNIEGTADSVPVLYRPDPKANITFMQQWAGAYFYSMLPLSESCRWKIIVEAPCAPLIADISQYGLLRLGLLGLLILFAVALSHFLSKGFISGIVRLQTLTRSLPGQLANVVNMEWPRSSIEELSELSGKFREMAVALHKDMAKRGLVEEELRYKNIILATQQEVSIEGILVVDARGRIVSCNRRFVELWNIPSELIKYNEDRPVLEFLSNQVADPESFVQKVQSLHEHSDEISDEEITLADGRVLERYSAPMLGTDRAYLGRVWSFRDVTERKQAEAALRSSLEEKVSLLKEVHHRVKNNLQIVASLLSLQAGKIEDPQTLEALQDTGNRVRSMALLHEVLYHSESLARIDFAVYSKEICAHLLRSLGASAPQATLDNRIGPIGLPLEQSVPCGLIINELVSNALKHAFPGGRSGTISLELGQTEEGILSLRISDDGVGLPPGFDPSKTTTLGLRLVARLANQLNGNFAVAERDDSGTSFQVVFPAPENTLHGELR